jgi:hypothetical protein
MNSPAASTGKRYSALHWGLLFGLAGFAAGFFGPVLLNPEANQGPLLGLLLTGPGGVLLGVILGAIFNQLPLPARSSSMFMVALAAAGVLVILYFSLPPPKLVGNVINAEIKSCSKPDVLTDAAVARWKKELAHVTGFKPRSDWESEMKEKSSQLTGVVVEVQVLRKRGVYENRKPWNAGEKYIDRWHQAWEARQLYVADAGKTCGDFIVGAKQLYFPQSASPASKLWPPENALDFLGLQILAGVPEDYRR